MKLHILRLQNYRKHYETEVEFADGISAVVGQNGSGKSTILEAIGFALFGAAATRTGKELLRHNDAAPSDPVVVELSFSLGGSTYEVRRELRGKNLTPSAHILVDGVSMVAPGSGSDGAATEELERRLGMGRDAFFTTIVARQKELNRLADLGPTERKRLLLRMLGVDAVETAITKARAKRRQAEDFLAGLRANQPDETQLQARLTELLTQRDGLRKAKEAAAGKWVKAKQAHQAAEAAWAKLEAAQKQFTAQQQEQTLLEQQLQHAGRAAADAERQWLEARQAQAKVEQMASIEAEVKEAQGWQQAAKRRVALEAERKTLVAKPVPVPEPAFLEAAKEALESIREAVATTRNGVAAAKKEIQSNEAEQEKLRTIGTAPCPTCKRPMESHAPVLQKELEDQHAALLIAIGEGEANFKQLQADQEAARTEISRLEAEHAAAAAANATAAQEQQRREAIEAELAALPNLPENWEAKAMELESAYREWVALDAKAREMTPRTERKEKTAEDLQTLRTKLEALQANQLPDQSKTLAEAERARNQARDAERAAERASLEADHADAAAGREVAHAESELAKAKQQSAQIQEKETDARYWAALAGSRGGGLLDAFKEHLVGRIGPAVSAEASRLMSAFTGGRYTEVILDQEYKITVSDQGIPYPLDRFSGGESDLVHLALRLAVSRLIAERSGADLRFLALDEVFGSLDEQRKENVLGALHGLGGLYAQVLLVTHQEGLRDALDATILVEDGRVTVHNG